MKVILDRIEKNSRDEKVAVFEYEDTMLNIHEYNMPEGFIDKIKSGDIIECVIENNHLYSPVILVRETEEKQKEMQDRLNKLFNRNKK